MIKNQSSSSVTWTKISNGFGSNSYFLDVLEQSPANIDILYVSKYNELYRSDNANAATPSWTNLSATVPSYYGIDDIEAHPTNENIVYIAKGSDGVYKSSNKGASWVNISGTLPDVHVNCILYDKDVNEGLYIGTDIGVFFKNGALNDWVLLGGLPAVEAMELEMFYSTQGPANKTLRIGTYGRGLWEIAINCCTDNLECNDADLCTQDVCLNNVCKNQFCNDNDPCTNDLCNSGNCIFQPMVCNDNNPCTNDACSAGVCIYQPIICDDANLCTIDICTNGVCSFTAKFCDDNNPCTDDLCVNGGCTFSCAVTTQTGGIKWQKVLGGSAIDYGYSVKQTAEGGYIIAGRSSSNNIHVSGNHGNSDIWVVKLDKSANLEWQKTYGGTSSDQTYSIELANEGYIISGYTYSNNGDVSGNHGYYDFWIIKINLLGNLVWQKTFGGTGTDLAYSAQVTADNGLIVVGSSQSNDGDASLNQGDNDFWIIKLDSSANLMWQKSYGGSLDDIAYSVRQTDEGGYVVVGYSNSTNGDISGNKGGYDYWVLRLNSTGNIIWKKNLGGTANDFAYSVQLTPAKGYIIAGTTLSTNGDVTGSHGNSEYWIVKLDSLGNLLWQKAIGGSSIDDAKSIARTQDSGYVVAGYSRSTNGNVTGNHGLDDFWVVKLDSMGTIEWQKSIGGTNYETANSVIQTNDGSFVIAGYSSSSNGDVSINYGNYDYWIVKLNGSQSTCCNDGNACTIDSCSEGLCFYPPVICNDNNACTVDNCAPLTGCIYTLQSCTINISGKIQTEMNIAVPGVTVILSGDASDTVVTSGDGFYSFTVPLGGDYTVTPSKNNDTITNNGITTLDITRIRRHVLGSMLLDSPYKVIAADATNNSFVTTGDIPPVRVVVLNNTARFPPSNSRLWEFVNSDQVFAGPPYNPFPFTKTRSYVALSSNQTNQDFIGVKVGDVSNNWNSAIQKMEALGEVNFVMSQYQALPGEEIIVPVRVKDFNAIAGYQFTLTWNPEVLSLLEVVNQSIPGYFGEQYISDGILTTSWNDGAGAAVTLADEATVFELKFKVIGANGTSSEIKIGSEITASEAYTSNLDLLDIAATHGSVKVGEILSSLNTQHSTLNTRLSVQPNPFSNTTNIIFSIPQDEMVSITIYDLVGRQVKQISAQFSKGEHRIEWAGDDENGNNLGNGLYHVRMEAGGDFIVAKAILIK